VRDPVTPDPNSPFPPPRPLLPSVPVAQREPVMNVFLDQVRIAGVTAPDQIVRRALAILRQTFERRSAWTPEYNLDPLARAILAIVSHPGEALALARQAVAHDQLPPERKAGRKTERAKQVREAYMAGDPLTDKQLNYLKALGYTGSVASKLEASRRIDALLHARKEERHGR
jgi:hypothetical protein